MLNNSANRADPGWNSYSLISAKTRSQLGPTHVRLSLLQNSQQFGNRTPNQPKSIQSEFGKKCDHNSDRHTHSPTGQLVDRGGDLAFRIDAGDALAGLV